MEVECKCGCHEPDSHMIHIMNFCRTTPCGKHLVEGYDEHIKICLVCGDFDKSMANINDED